METNPDANRRRAPRRALRPGPLPGRLLNFEMTAQVEAEGVDVSRNGMGIVTEQPLEAGVDVWYAVQDRIIRLKVQHCTATPAGRYRCGLFTGHAWETIDRLMDRIGYLKPAS